MARYLTLGIFFTLISSLSPTAAAVTRVLPSYNDCVGLADLLPSNVFLPGNATYISQEASYFTDNESQLRPACIIQPNNAQDVATIINYLRTSEYASQTLAAVRSGGHTNWAGAANIQDGITIDLARFNTTTLDASTKVACIGPGARWGSVYSTLAPHGLAVMGGRVATVGVGGIILGGEYSLQFLNFSLIVICRRHLVFF
jgi:FAD/FMN-containing dehydrogenase